MSDPLQDIQIVARSYSIDLKLVNMVIANYCKSIFDALHNLVPFGQFKNVKITHGGVTPSVTLQATLKPATLLKVSFLRGCFSSFLNCTIGIKSRIASHILFIHFA